MTLSPFPADPVPTPAPSLPPWQRTIAVFANPAHAWGGLLERAQWWWPLLLSLAVTVVGMVLVYDSAILPATTSTYDQQLEAGNMTPQQVEQAEEFLSGPAGRAIVIGQ